MKFKVFKRLLLVLAFCATQMRAATFSDLYYPMEQMFFANTSLTSAQVASMTTAAQGILAIQSTLTPVQMTYFTGLLQNNILKSSMFTPAQLAVFQQILTSLGGSAVISSTGFTPVGTRITTAISQLSTASTLAGLTTMVTQAQAFLTELPGTITTDKGNYLMLIQGLISRANILSATAQVSTLNDLYSQANNITGTQLVAYLSRVTTSTNFVDPAEQAIFTNTMVTLSQKLSSLSNDDLINFQSALSAAYGSSNFSASQKNDILTISNELSSFYSTKLSSASSGATGTTGTVGTTPNNFNSYFQALQTGLASIKTQYRNGTEGEIQALNTKNTTFKPMMTTLLTYLGDMVTSSYLVAGGNLANIPQPPSGMLIDEQTAAYTFVTQDVASTVSFSSDTAQLNSIAAQIQAVVSVDTRLQYLNNIYQTTTLTTENQIRMLWHLQYLVQCLRNTSAAQNLTATQRTTLRNFISVLSRDTSFSTYSTQLTTLLSTFDANAAAVQPAFDLSTVVPTFIQALNGQQSVISWSYATAANIQDPIDAILQSGQYLGAYGQTNNIQLYGTYDLAPQNIFTPILNSDGSFVFLGNGSAQNTVNNSLASNSILASNSTLPQMAMTVVTVAPQAQAGQTSQNVLGTLAMSVNSAPNSTAACCYLLTGSALNSINIQSKGTNSYLAEFSGGVVRTTDPTTGALEDNNGQNKVFTITPIDSFSLKLIAARQQSTLASIIAAYQAAYQGLAAASTASQAVLTYNCKRLLADIKYFILSQQQSTTTWQAFKQDPAATTLIQLLTTINSDSNFAAYTTSIAAIKTLMQQQTGGTTVAANVIVSSLKNGDIISVRYGRYDDVAAHYMIAEKETDGSYYIKMVCTTPADPAAQFKVTLVPNSSGVSCLTLESILFPSFLITYTNSRGNIYQDLDLIANSVSSSTNFMFNVVTSAGDVNSVCLVNLTSGGYLSVDSNGSLTTTDFSRDTPVSFTEQATSRFSIIPVSQTPFYNNLHSIVAASTLDLNALKGLFTAKGAKMDAEQIVSYLKEIYYWVYALHATKDNTAWAGFISSSGLAPNLISFLTSLSSGTLQKTFAPYSVLIDYIQRLISFVPEGASTPILPTNRGVFWLTESEYSFASTGRWGLSFAMQTSGICRVYLADAGDNTNTRCYEVRIGEVDISGNRQVAFFSSGVELQGTRVNYPNFDENDLVDFQIIFDTGSVALADANGTVSSYKDPKYSFTGPTIRVGLYAENFDAEFEDVASGLALYNSEFLDNLAQTPYSSIVSGLVSKLNGLSTADISTISQAVTVAALPFRLEGALADWNSLKAALVALAQKQFIKSSYAAKTQVNTAINSLTTVAPPEQIKPFLENLYDIASYYMTSYPNKTATLTAALQQIITNNLTTLISQTFQDTDKAYVRDLMNRIQSTTLFPDSQTFVSMAATLNAQIQLSLPTSGLLSDDITYLTTAYQAVSTTAQRSTLIGLLSQVVTNAKTAGSSVSATDLTNLGTLLANIAATTTFKDIVGSILYLQDVLVNAESEPSFVATELSLNKGAANTISDLKAYVFKLVSFVQQGFDTIHSGLVTDLIAQLNTARANTLFVNSGPDFDFMISYLTSLGNINTLISNVNTNYGNVTNLASRDLFLSEFGTIVIGYIQYQISAGSVSDSDRAAVNAALTALSNNSWFKDATAAAKIASFQTSVNAVASPIGNITALQSRFNNLASDQTTVNQFITDLTNLSKQIKNLLLAGTWYDATGVQTFNSLIDSISKAATSGANGAQYLIYVMISYGTPPLNLQSLKLTVSGDMTLFPQLAALSAMLTDGTTFTTPIGRNTFITNFGNLVTSWKLMVVLDPTTQNISGGTFANFYHQFDQFLQNAASNVNLLPYKTNFDQARCSVIEDVFDPIERIGILNTFLSNAANAVSADGVTQLIGGRTLDQVVAAIRGVVSAFNTYQAFHFDQVFSTTKLSSLLTLCQSKTVLTNYTPTTTANVLAQTNTTTSSTTTPASYANFGAEMTAYQANLGVIPSIDVRVGYLNTELARVMANNEPLSEIQQTNILAIVTKLATILTTTTQAQGSLIDMATLNNLLGQLNSSTYFDDPTDRANLAAAITTIAGINFNASSTTGAPTVTTTNTVSPMIVYSSGQIATSASTTATPIVTYASSNTNATTVSNTVAPQITYSSGVVSTTAGGIPVSASVAAQNPSNNPNMYVGGFRRGIDYGKTSKQY